MEITTLAVRQIAAGALLRELTLRAGADIAVRVVAAPPEGGRGTISLAGQLLDARLPAGLVAGQKLSLRLVGSSEEGEVVLKVTHEAAPEATRADTARAAGALAVSGDPKLVEVANALQQP